jgi:hypothetical protein
MGVWRVRVLVACEFSGIVREAFRRRGHDAWSCDLLPSEDESPFHFEGDVLQALDGGWDLMIAHPPCTYLTNTAVCDLHKPRPSKRPSKALYGAARWQALEEACRLFNALQDAGIPRIAIENPVPHPFARYRVGRYSQIINPWEFGHGETKKTCLWLKNLPPLRATHIVAGRRQRVHYESPGPNRWKNRSRTYQGIADAMAEQWG